MLRMAPLFSAVFDPSARTLAERPAPLQRTAPAGRAGRAQPEGDAPGHFSFTLIARRIKDDSGSIPPKIR
jgi:hypothetical protein